MSTSSSLLVGLRGAVSCLVTFLIFVSSVSLLIGRRVQKSQVQLLVQHRHQQEAVTVAAAGNQESQVPWTDELKGEAARGSGEEECNLSVGRWVYDNTSQPMYSGHNCSFILGEVACQKYGQNNTKYQYWKWQPDGCDLPRFNATKMLEKLRNKRMVFVGDSINRNQWISLVCMVESSIPKGLKMRVYNGSLISFKAFEYNATIDFYWSPLILKSNSDNPIFHRVDYRIIRAEKIEKHANAWSNANILVFNSYLE